MPLQYRIYDFKQPQPQWKDTAIKAVGIFLAIFFIWVLTLGVGALFSNFLNKLIMIPIFIISLVLHELAHAYMADFLGDPTPRLTGRLSLNPIKHLDLWGTLIFIFSGFGWAKPVQVDASNFRNPSRAMVSVALAGPLSNLLIAIAAALSFKLFYVVIPKTEDYIGFIRFIHSILIFTSSVNITLAMFNLIPIPPLDGSRLLHYLLPPQYKAKYYQLQQHSIFILIFMLMFAGQLISPAVYSITRLIWSLIV